MVRAIGSVGVSLPTLPWECVVVGVPASVQGSPRAKNRWKTAVADAARDAWPVGVLPLVGAVSLKLTYFHDGAPLDADNMIKPTQDALISIAFLDDRQVKDVHASLRDLNGRYEVRSLRPALAKGFISGEAFVHIHIEDVPDLGVLP